jgi:methionyl-tRNA formyltransferase
MNQAQYVVAGSKPWSRRVFDEIIAAYPGSWHFTATLEELSPARLRLLQPRYVFFLHWSWQVPVEILQEAECVCFHMTDVPYGRGGSPLQNLIMAGHRSTKLTALRMVEELDAGPVYFKEDLSLEGGAEEIYLRASYACARMIRKLIDSEPAPETQTGRCVLFRRRRKEESRIPPLESVARLHDFLRMLDADGYPKAFLEHAGFRYEFSRASLYDGRIVADVVITRPEGEKQ